MILEPVNILQIVFIVQAGFGALLLANKIQYRGLVVLLISIVLLMCFNLLEETGLTRHYHLVTPIFSLSNGPLFYLFVRQLVYNDRVLSSKDWLHLLPAILSLPFTQWTQVVLFLGTVSQMLYALFCFSLLNNYHKASMETSSDAYSLQVLWVNKVLTAIVLVVFIDLIRLNLQPYLPLILSKNGYLIIQSSFFIIFSILIYKAIRQPDLFNSLNEFELRQEAQSNQGKNPSDNQNATAIFQQINDFILKQELYRQPRLSLRQLADVIGLSEKDISWAVNAGGKQSFCDYINFLRVEAVKQKLKESESPVKLLDIALDAGFNSKSTFNAIFKKG